MFLVQNSPKEEGTVVLKNPIGLTKGAPILHNILQGLGQTSICTNKINSRNDLARRSWQEKYK